MFAEVAVAPPDAIFGLVAEYRADPSPNKINLSVGAYRTAEGLPYVLPCVREVGPSACPLVV
jgi:aspartate aminotransferase, cytoplasmic